ncbi:hypothetical protein EDD11_009369 [Mortierella claussenii]|nr:hypothetical protein EDD11_009369 [Mortierella claussenii]
MVKSSSTTPYCFVSGQTDKSKVASSSKYVLNIRQQPQRAKVCGMKERDRRPIDPPPIVQIKLADPTSDRNKDYLQSPYLFMCCNLVHADDVSGEIVAPAHRALAGTVVSSLNRLKDVDNSDGGFFVFGDMSVRIEGRFCLRFTLFELIEGEVVQVMTSVSNPMTVYSSKAFPGMSESTFLSRCFSDQGVRIRIRKDHHVKPKKPLSGDGSEGPTMHSPPLSTHEAEHSDNEVDVYQSAKRFRSSTYSYEDDASHLHGHPVRHVAIAARPKHADSRYSSSEPQDHSPPSSPQVYLAQDSVPSRPHPNPYGAPEDAPRRFDSHSRQHQHQHPYYSPGRPSYHDTRPFYRHEQTSASYHHPHHPRERPHAEYRRLSSSAGSGYHHPSHEHGHYSEAPPSYSYAPSHPMGAAHSSSPSASSSSSVYNSSRTSYHSSTPHFPPPVNAGRHGFPAALLNDQDQEMEYTPVHSHSHHQGYAHVHDHGHGHGPASGRSHGHQAPEAYHSRTPSMSSQHSDGNFSPPHPFSPPESQMARGHSPTSPATAALPSILPALSRPHSGGEKIQLPPIHMLSTQSPIMTTAHSTAAVDPSHGRSFGDQHVYPRS